MELVIRGLMPLSYNSRKKEEYQEKIRSAFQRKYKGNVPKFPASEELYARVYFFTSDGVHVDSDNISKPIWDAVNGLIYDDDCRVVMRTAAVIDVNLHPYNMLDTSSMDGSEAAELVQGLSDKKVKCLYIECGRFEESMMKIGKANV